MRCGRVIKLPYKTKMTTAKSGRTLVAAPTDWALPLVPPKWSSERFIGIKKRGKQKDIYIYIYIPGNLAPGP